MDWGTIGNGLAVAFIVFLSSSILAMLRMIYLTYREVMTLKGRSERRRAENIMQFRAIKAIIHCLRTGNDNGPLTSAESEIDKYLHTSVH